MNDTDGNVPQINSFANENYSSQRFEKIEHLILETPDVVYRYRLSPSPGFEFINPAIEQITGFTPEEHYRQGNLGLKLLFPYDPEALKTLLPNNPSLKNLKALRFENHTGSSTTEHISLPVYDLQGEIIAIEGIARDLTRWRSGGQYTKWLLPEYPPPVKYQLSIFETRCQPHFGGIRNWHWIG